MRAARLLPISAPPEAILACWMDPFPGNPLPRWPSIAAHNNGATAGAGRCGKPRCAQSSARSRRWLLPVLQGVSLADDLRREPPARQDPRTRLLERSNDDALSVDTRLVGLLVGEGNQT